MATVKDCGEMGYLIYELSEMFKSGCSIDEMKKIYHDDSLGIVTEDIPYTEAIITEALETVKTFFVNNCGLNVNEDLTRVTTLINEWNEHVAPIFGVKCNTFDEFAIQAATVSSQWAKYKSAEAIPHQQPVQPQQNRMFVDVNTLVSENTYLKSLNASKDEEIKSLRERLVALGQSV